MSHRILVVLVALLGTIPTAESRAANHAVYAEVIGTGLGASVLLDHLTLRIGVGALPIDGFAMTIPLAIGGLVSFGDHHLELGASATVVTAPSGAGSYRAWWRGSSLGPGPVVRCVFDLSGGRRG